MFAFVWSSCWRKPEYPLGMRVELTSKMLWFYLPTFAVEPFESVVDTGREKNRGVQ